MDSINVDLIQNNLLKKIKNTDETDDDEDNKIIQIYSFFSINEINISNKIKQINNYNNNYDVIKDYIFIKKTKIDNKEINQDDNQKYILITYNKNNYLYFNDFFCNLPNPKLFILHILDSYTVLLNSLIKLNENNICFFNLSSKNIVFPQNFKPLIKGFNKSIFIENIYKEDYILNIIKNIKDYTHKPLEVHVLFYLIINKKETLSYSLIDIIITNYIKNMNILDLFNREKYKSICIEYLKQYINKPKIEIISDLLKCIHTWDNYSLSIIYLHIISNISKVFSLKDNFINKFIILLFKNIYPNSLKRETLQDTFNQYNNLYEEFTDWSFINTIPKKKIEELYEILF